MDGTSMAGAAGSGITGVGTVEAPVCNGPDAAGAEANVDVAE